MIQNAFTKASSKQEGKLVTAKPEAAQAFKAIPPLLRLFAIRRKLAGRGISIFSSAARNSIREYLDKRRKKIAFVFPPPAHLIEHEGGTKMDVLDKSTGQTWVFHEFKSSGTFKVAENFKCHFMMVAGGGAGATTSSSFPHGGGGGGGGEVYYNPEITIPSGIYNVVVGAGGSLISQTNANRFANNGSDSYMISTNSYWGNASKLVQTKGGGGGGAGTFMGAPGGSSGGGGNGFNGHSLYNNNGFGFGNNGAKGNTFDKISGGGGGAGDALAWNKNGGSGKVISIAGVKSYTVGAGGNGGVHNVNENGAHGTVNTGNGGHGAGGVSTTTVQVQTGTEIVWYEANYSGSLRNMGLPVSTWWRGETQFGQDVANKLVSMLGDPGGWWGTWYGRAKHFYNSFKQFSNCHDISYSWKRPLSYSQPVYGNTTVDTHFSGGNGGSGILVIAYKKG